MRKQYAPPGYSVVQVPVIWVWGFWSEATFDLIVGLKSTGDVQSPAASAFASSA